MTSLTRCAPSCFRWTVGGEPLHLASLDFGPDSIDGWLNRIGGANDPISVAVVKVR